MKPGPRLIPPGTYKAYAIKRGNDKFLIISEGEYKGQLVHLPPWYLGPYTEIDAHIMVEPLHPGTLRNVVS